MPHTALEKLRCAERELRMRNKMYPVWIAEGKMTDLQAKREIELMEDIAADYRAQTELDLKP